METTQSFLPVPDPHLPLRERRYPYRPAHAGEVEEAREAVGKLIVQVDALLVEMAFKMAPRLSADERADMVAETMFQLWRYVAPRFDRHQGVKPSTFIHHCAANRMRQLLRSRRRRPPTEYLGNAVGAAAPNKSSDRQIELLAAAIFAAPEAFGFTVPEADALRALAKQAPSVSLKSISDDLGYAFPSSFSSVLRKVKERLAEIDPLDFDLVLLAKRDGRSCTNY